jgi:hypothetical protein
VRGHACRLRQRHDAPAQRRSGQGRRRPRQEQITELGPAGPFTGDRVVAGTGEPAVGSAARDFLGIHPEGDIVTYDDDPLEDPFVLARPAAVVVRGIRVR